MHSVDGSGSLDFLRIAFVVGIDAMGIFGEAEELEELDYSLLSYIERSEMIRSWMELRFTFIEEIHEL